MSKEIDIKSIQELEKGKIYHIIIDKDIITKDLVQSFTKQLKDGGIRAFVSHGEVQVEELADLFKAQSDDNKKILLAALRTVTFIDPVKHEQAK